MLTEIPDGSNKLADDEIAANSITFLLAGYETTANTLAYTTYLLALNPEVQEKLYQEIKEKFNDDEVSLIFFFTFVTSIHRDADDIGEAGSLPS